MPKQTKSQQNKSPDEYGLSFLGNAIKEVASIPGEVGRTVQKEMVEFLQKAASPLRTEFRIKDLLQVIIGASILAVPVGFTQETWDLGRSMHIQNIIILCAISVIFIGTFVYYNYYRNKFMKNWPEYVKRVFSTYVFSIIIVALLLTIIEVAPWDTDFVLAIKRVILVAFPSSMSAVVADTIK